MNAPALVERFDGFNYGYWMNCECGETTFISAADYEAQANNCRVPCAHCGTKIHFGPRVAAIRDRNDPALDNVAALAWYHTSTSPDWPSPDYAQQIVDSMTGNKRQYWPSREGYLAERSSKALHLGTYEAAIENMLRRMENQDDGGSQFYLYRVALSPSRPRINTGYRDENQEIAADLSIGDLDGDDLDVVRYLNVHEALGTLSLAVRPQAIAAVQSIPVPLGGLAMIADSAHVRVDIERVQRAEAGLAKAMAATGAIGHMELREMQLGMRPDPEGVAKRAGKAQNRVYSTWHELLDRLGECLLPSVSTEIRGDFNDAMRHWQSANQGVEVTDFVERYAMTATLLERPRDVIDVIAAQSWRAVA